MRRRLALVVTLVLAGAACTFGVTLEDLTDGPEPVPEGGMPVDTSPPLDDAGPMPPGDDALAPSEPDAEAGTPVELLQIGAGFGFTCVRKSNNRVACWGRGTEGRLGNGSALSRATPVDVPDLDDVVDLSVGQNHACAVRTSGQIYCWGDNALRQLGIGGTTPPAESRTPQPVSDITNAKEVAASHSFTCALLANETVSCWGSNGDGQLGDGTQLQRATPVPVKNLTGIKQVAVSVTAACALNKAGEVYCWGDNSDGQSGSGDASAGDLTIPRKVAALTGVSSLSSGPAGDHFCAVMGDETARCWGFGDTGCLGNGTTVDSALPVAPSSLDNVRRIATGNGFTCAQRKNGSLTCFGTNAWRVLPTANAPNTANIPLDSDLKDVTAIATGAVHACAIVNRRTVSCWGTDQWGALGRDRAIIFDAPTKVSTATSFRSIGAGRDTMCGVDSPDAGTLSCWGLNSSRQLARADVQITATPAPVPLGADVRRVAPSELHTCAVISDGGVRCWGDGQSGQLGFSLGANVTTTSTPGIFAAPPAADVGTGATFSCALLRTGEAMCAGAAANGQLGRAGSGSSVPTFVTVDGGTGSVFAGIDELIIGRAHACAIHGSRQKLSCWGANGEGQLGTGGTTARVFPLEVPSLGAFRIDAAAAGRAHTCAIVDKNDGAGGQVHCFGSNSSGQLSGNGASGNAVRVVPLTGKARAIAAGDEHTCALLGGGTVMCWGSGALGQLGNGTRTDSNQPVAVSGIKDATAITAEASHTCALTPAGTFCWGTDFAGEAGVAVISDNLPAPVQGL